MKPIRGGGLLLTSQPEYARFLSALPGRETDVPAGRIYIGDEFCERKLPSEKILGWLEQTGETGIRELTLMTPFLTDNGIPMVETILGRLCRAFPGGFEVVVNDLGTLEILRQGRYPGAEPVCGRLLSSRYMWFPDFPDEFLQFLSDSGIRRIELNSLRQLQATSRVLRERGIKTHFHWPYMLLAASRFCAADSGFAGYYLSRDTISTCSSGCERFMGACAGSKGPGFLVYGNAYLTRHPGPSVPPGEADRIVESDIRMKEGRNI